MNIALCTREHYIHHQYDKLVFITSCCHPPSPSQVVVPTAISALVSYTKVGVVVQLHDKERDQDTALLLAGIVTQLGSLLGAVLFFILVYYANIFTL